jgi:hypothetical protein
VQPKQPNRFTTFVNSPRPVAWFLVVAALGCGVGSGRSLRMTARLRFATTA